MIDENFIFSFSATSFTKIISEFEETQRTLAIALTNNKTMLQGVQEAFAVNMETVNKEVEKLENRFKAISK